jgi:hypothetical protein
LLVAVPHHQLLSSTFDAPTHFFLCFWLRVEVRARATYVEHALDAGLEFETPMLSASSTKNMVFTPLAMFHGVLLVVCALNSLTQSETVAVLGTHAPACGCAVPDSQEKMVCESIDDLHTGRTFDTSCHLLCALADEGENYVELPTGLVRTAAGAEWDWCTRSHEPTDLQKLRGGGEASDPANKLVVRAGRDLGCVGTRDPDACSTFVHDACYAPTSVGADVRSLCPVMCGFCTVDGCEDAIGYPHFFENAGEGGSDPGHNFAQEIEFLEPTEILKLGMLLRFTDVLTTPADIRMALYFDSGSAPGQKAGETAVASLDGYKSKAKVELRFAASDDAPSSSIFPAGKYWISINTGRSMLFNGNREPTSAELSAGSGMLFYTNQNTTNPLPASFGSQSNYPKVLNLYAVTGPRCTTTITTTVTSTVPTPQPPPSPTPSPTPVPIPQPTPSCKCSEGEGTAMCSFKADAKGQLTNTGSIAASRCQLNCGLAGSPTQVYLDLESGGKYTQVPNRGTEVFTWDIEGGFYKRQSSRGTVHFWKPTQGSLVEFEVYFATPSSLSAVADNTAQIDPLTGVISFASSGTTFVPSTIPKLIHIVDGASNLIYDPCPTTTTSSSTSTVTTITSTTATSRTTTTSGLCAENTDIPIMCQIESNVDQCFRELFAQTCPKLCGRCFTSTATSTTATTTITITTTTATTNTVTLTTTTASHTVKFVLFADCTALKISSIKFAVFKALETDASINLSDLLSINVACGSVNVVLRFRTSAEAAKAKSAMSQRQVRVVIDGVPVEAILLKETTTSSTSTTRTTTPCLCAPMTDDVEAICKIENGAPTGDRHHSVCHMKCAVGWTSVDGYFDLPSGGVYGDRSMWPGFGVARGCYCITHLLLV